MTPPTWLNQARQRLATFVTTIEDWAPSTLYGAIAGASILPLLATTGDPKDALAGMIGGLGANLIANQLEAWKDRSNGDTARDHTEQDVQAFAKQLSDAARTDSELRKGLDELLSKIGALEVVIKNAADDERDDVAAQLARQFAKIQSSLDVEKIYVGRNWITLGDLNNSNFINDSSFVIVGDNNKLAGPGSHIGDVYNIYAQDPEIATRRNARRNAYLNHVYEESSRLSLGGINRKAAESDSEVSVPLDAIYTALWTEQVMFEVHRVGSDQKVFVEGLQSIFSAVTQLDRHTRLVLLGAPGSGKSTFVNYVAQCLAGEILGKSSANLQTLTQPLPDDVEKIRGDKDKEPPRQPWSHGSLIPVRVILRHFAAAHLPVKSGKASANLLWQHICAELNDVAQGDFAEDLKSELQQTGGLLLLDGLDEVPDADQQREQLKAVINDFAATFGKCRILITSRPYAYKQESWRLAKFEDTTLAAFSDPQIRLFVQRWYEHVAPLRNYKAGDALGRAQRLKQVIFASDRLHALAEQPLLLTLMASLHAWHGSDLPEKRERLYAEAVDLLLERWEKQRVERQRDGSQSTQPSLQEYLQVGRETILSVLEQIAYEVHAGQTDLDGCADISRTLLVNRLIDVSNNSQVRPLELIDYLSQRAGLLLPEGNTLFRFPHRTFQEYLAARYLTSNQVDYPDKIAELLRSDPGRWREVALLAIAKAAEGYGSSVWNMVDAFCSFVPSDPAFILADAWGAQIAGQGLLESAKLENLNPRNEEKVERVRQGLICVMRSGKFAPPERALAGRTLAGLGDPRFDRNRWFLPDEPMLGFIEIPAGKFVMGSNQKEDSVLLDASPQHELDLPSFYISHFPITVAQFSASGIKPSDKNAFADPANHPICYVTWDEAIEYCNWLDRILRFSPATPSELAGKLRHGWKITLPSEAEWEKAARGTKAQIYPWQGSEIDPTLANYNHTGIGSTSAVGCFPAGASPFGLEEMSGNVCEWTRSIYADYPYPSDRKGLQEQENLQKDDRKRRVLRGGAFGDGRAFVRCAFRVNLNPDDRVNYVGFRVCASPFTSGL